MKLSDLKPNPNNPRIISEQDYEKLKNSLKDLPKMLRLRPIVLKSKKDLTIVGGSGSTLIACEQLGRTCFMMELDERYTDVIRKRYHKLVNEGNEEGWEEGTKVIAREKHDGKRAELKTA